MQLTPKLKSVEANQYMIAYLLEPLPIGNSFGRWPLHITLVPWFSVKDQHVAAQSLQTAANSHSTFRVIVGKTTFLGLHKNIEVSTIENSKPLHILRQTILAGLIDSNNQFMQLAETHEFIPHITKKSFANVQSGYQLLIQKLHLIESPVINRQTRLKKVVGIGELS